MSSRVPKSVRVWGRKPSSFNDIDSGVQFICRLVKIIIGDCRLVGSHFKGYPSPDSDIDISVNSIEDMLKFKAKVEEVGDLFGVSIDLCLIEGGFDVV